MVEICLVFLKTLCNKSQRANMKSELCKLVLRTPIGKVLVVQSHAGVREITLDRGYEDNEDIVNGKYKNLDVVVESFEGPWHPSTDGTIEWLKLFFSPKRDTDSLQHLPTIDNTVYAKENFTGKVLRTLANDVPSGKTVSYAELAKLCDSPKACRAVGQAMRANPLPLVVPCHRVISSNGTAGHYMSGKGDNIKKWLLNMEKEF